MLNLPYDYGLDLILKASEKEVERAAWELWLTFDGEAKKETPFNKFLAQMKEPSHQNNDKRTDEEVLQDAEHILNLMKRS